VKITGLYPRVRVDTSATAAVGQAGGVLLTRTVTATGLDRLLSAALARWRKALAVHDPGKVITDLALSLALGGDCLADLAVLRAEPGVYGRAASDPTVSRAIAALAAEAPAVLKAIDTARAAARERAWRLAGEHAPGHGTDAKHPLVIDLDATLATDQDDRRAEDFQDLPGTVEGIRRSPDHDRQGSVLSALLPATNRSIQHVESSLGGEAVQFYRDMRVNRAHVDEEGIFGGVRQDPVRRGIDLTHVGRVRQDCNNGIRTAYGLPDRCRFAAAQLNQSIRLHRRSVESDDVLSGPDQVRRHGKPHDAKTDECDSHAVLFPCQSPETGIPSSNLSRHPNKSSLSAATAPTGSLALIASRMAPCPAVKAMRSTPFRRRT